MNKEELSILKSIVKKPKLDKLGMSVKRQRVIDNLEKQGFIDYKASVGGITAYRVTKKGQEMLNKNEGRMKLVNEINDLLSIDESNNVMFFDNTVGGLQKSEFDPMVKDIFKGSGLSPDVNEGPYYGTDKSKNAHYNGVGLFASDGAKIEDDSIYASGSLRRYLVPVKNSDSEIAKEFWELRLEFDYSLEDDLMDYSEMSKPVEMLATANGDFDAKKLSKDIKKLIKKVKVDQKVATKKAIEQKKQDNSL